MAVKTSDSMKALQLIKLYQARNKSMLQNLSQLGDSLENKHLKTDKINCNSIAKSEERTEQNQVSSTKSTSGQSREPRDCVEISDSQSVKSTDTSSSSSTNAKKQYQKKKSNNQNRNKRNFANKNSSSLKSIELLEKNADRAAQEGQMLLEKLKNDLDEVQLKNLDDARVNPSYQRRNYILTKSGIFVPKGHKQYPNTNCYRCQKPGHEFMDCTVSDNQLVTDIFCIVCGKQFIQVESCTHLQNTGGSRKQSTNYQNNQRQYHNKKQNPNDGSQRTFQNSSDSISSSSRSIQSTRLNTSSSTQTTDSDEHSPISPIAVKTITLDNVLKDEVEDDFIRNILALENSFKAGITITGIQVKIPDSDESMLIELD